MPPKLNLQRFTQIDPQFIHLMRELYGQWLKLYSSRIQQSLQNPGSRSVAFYPRYAKRLLPIVQGKSPAAREGLDYEVARLQVAPFSRFYVIEGPHPDYDKSETIRWLVGTTRHVSCKLYSNRSQSKGELGCYDIYIPETAVVHPNLYDIHMIPQRNPKSIRRHWHHYISTDRVIRNPLTYRTGNCYGDYEPELSSLMQNPDYPELFRQLYNHLCTFGYLPPVHELDFDIETPEAR